MRYKAENFFMVRIPIFSINEHLEIINEDKNMSEQVQALINNEIFMEGIAVASPELYKRVEKAKREGTVLGDKKIYNSLLKYAIRAYSRTTPFGLFTGIGIGLFSDNTNMLMTRISDCKKRARVDMEWVNHIVLMLENDFRFMEHIKLYSNNSVYLKGGRLFNTYLSDSYVLRKSRSNTIVSIKFTKQLERLLDLCENGAFFEEIVDDIKRCNPNADEVIIKEYIKTLLENGYLFSELRMQKSNVDPLQHIANYVRRFETEKIKYADIDKIVNLIDEYNECKIGCGRAKIRDIQSQMQEITSVKNYLQVDYKINLKKNNIGENVKKECEEIVTTLMELGTCFSEPQHLQKYKSAFMEKYGSYREISILKLLDPDMGIGAPEGYQYPSQFSGYFNNFSKVNNAFAKKFSQMLLDKVLYANFSGEKSVIITDQDIEKLKHGKRERGTTEYPDAIDMNFFIYAKDTEALNRGEYKLALGPNWGTDMAGRTLGRFSDMLNEKEKSLYDGLYAKVKDLVKDEYILAEIVEEPSKGRLGNIILNKNNAEYQTTIGCMKNMNIKQINVKDILVGVDRKTNNFYLKSKKYGKQIKYVSFNMLSPLFNSNIGRFVKEISSINVSKFYQLMQNLAMDRFIYMPRIEYKNCILQPRLWKLSMKMLDSPKKYNEFMEKFYVWKTNWQIPDYVYQKKHDDIFIYNLNNETQTEELYRTLKRENEILLTEYGNEEFWLVNEMGQNFYSEVVFSFLKEKKENTMGKDNEEVFKINSCITKNQEPETERDKTRISGVAEDGWIYFKLYCHEIEDVISNEVLPFCNQWMEKGIIKQFYFIRYTDPHIHIRLRIQMEQNEKKICGEVCNIWLNNLIRNSKIKEYTINIYERELERYGGVKPFRYVEQFFCLDTMYIAEVFLAKRDEKINEQLVVMSNMLILNAFDYSLDHQLNLFERHITNLNNYKKEFKDSMKEYIEIFQSLSCYIPLKKMQFKYKEQLDRLTQLLNERNKVLNQYILKLNELDREGELTNTIDDIIFSLLHMHCNRFKGDRFFENKVLELTYRGIYAYKNYMKNKEMK